MDRAPPRAAVFQVGAREIQLDSGHRLRRVQRLYHFPNLFRGFPQNADDDGNGERAQRGDAGRMRERIDAAARVLPGRVVRGLVLSTGDEVLEVEAGQDFGATESSGGQLELF